MENCSDHSALPQSLETAGCRAAGPFPNAVVTSLVDQTKDYLTREAGIEVTRARRGPRCLDQLNLKQSTAVIGVGGDFGALIAFSLPAALVDVLYDRLTAAFTVPAGDEALYRREVVAEMANIIIGHCTAHISANGRRVTMSPPVLLEEAKPVPRMKDAVFESVSIDTPHGSFDINLVGPCGMFDAHLNYIQ
jgi:CheY-specific phosphatase CheX